MSCYDCYKTLNKHATLSFQQTPNVCISTPHSLSPPKYKTSSLVATSPESLFSAQTTHRRNPSFLNPISTIRPPSLPSRFLIPRLSHFHQRSTILPPMSIQPPIVHCLCSLRPFPQILIAPLFRHPHRIALVHVRSQYRFLRGSREQWVTTQARISFHSAL